MSETEKLEKQLSMIVKSVEGLQETSKDNQRVLSFLFERMKVDTEVKKERKSKVGGLVNHDEDSKRPDSEVTFKSEGSGDSALYPKEDEPIWPLMSSTSQEGAGLMEIQTENLQSEFKVLADVYSHVTIHNELKFVGTRAGFKASLKEAVNVICNSAKYIEVILKVLTYMHRKSVDPK